jgi:hypothetical protein
MNGLLDYDQTSGNIWGAPIQAMLHEAVQADTVPLRFPDQRSVFDDLERQMARFEAEQEAQIAEVRKSYVIPNDSGVETFLRSHRTLSQLLMEALPRLKEHFGAGSVFSLRAPIDPSGSQTLYAVVMWPGAANDVRKAFADFDGDWWMRVVRRASGNLSFTYELV